MRALLGDTLSSFSRRGARLLAGALAFYSLLSVAPLLVLAVQLAGLAYGEAAAGAELHRSLAPFLGEAGAQTLDGLLDAARRKANEGHTSVLSGLLLVYASTRLFSQLTRALNHMWGVEARSARGFRAKAMKQVRKRALAMAMIVLIGVVLIGLVAVNALLTAATRLASGVVETPALWHVLNAITSVVVATFLFAALFRVLPDVRIAWRDALAGALATAVLFSLGTIAVGVYLGHRGIGTAYGAAGSLVMLLLWVHYSAQIFFLGVAFTGELAKRRGRALEPTDHAVRIVVEADDAG